MFVHKLKWEVQSKNVISTNATSLPHSHFIAHDNKACAMDGRTTLLALDHHCIKTRIISIKHISQLLTFTFGNAGTTG